MPWNTEATQHTWDVVPYSRRFFYGKYRTTLPTCSTCQYPLSPRVPITPALLDSMYRSTNARLPSLVSFARDRKAADGSTSKRHVQGAVSSCNFAGTIGRLRSTTLEGFRHFHFPLFFGTGAMSSRTFRYEKQHEVRHYCRILQILSHTSYARMMEPQVFFSLVERVKSIKNPAINPFSSKQRRFFHGNPFCRFFCSPSW